MRLLAGRFARILPVTAIRDTMRNVVAGLALAGLVSRVRRGVALRIRAVRRLRVTIW